MIQCPECRQMIPDDSAFCDQCGKELRWCPECGRPKRGTQCPVCGGDLIPGRKWIAGGGESGIPHGSDVDSSVGSGGIPETRATLGTVRGGTVSEANGGAERSEAVSGVPPLPTRLVSPGMTLTLREGAFGRIGGIWPELAGCPYVSGSHGVISRTADGWAITDNGSTNGTFINDRRIPAGQATPIKAGDRVRIATLDFTVQ